MKEDESDKARDAFGMEDNVFTIEDGRARRGCWRGAVRL